VARRPAARADARRTLRPTRCLTANSPTVSLPSRVYDLCIDEGPTVPGRSVVAAA
jgi:hypothetical protein